MNKVEYNTPNRIYVTVGIFPPKLRCLRLLVLNLQACINICILIHKLKTSVSFSTGMYHKLNLVSTFSLICVSLVYR